MLIEKTQILRYLNDLTPRYGSRTRHGFQISNIHHRSSTRAPTDIEDRELCNNSWWLKAVNYCCIALRLRCFRISRLRLSITFHANQTNTGSNFVAETKREKEKISWRQKKPNSYLMPSVYDVMHGFPFCSGYRNQEESRIGET